MPRIARLGGATCCALALACFEPQSSAPDVAAQANTAAPLSAEQRARLLAQLDPAWQVVEDHHLRRSFEFPDFRTGLEFVNRVGALAEQLNHHPDVLLRWGEVRLEIWTHSSNALQPADFALAAQCDRIRSELQVR